MNTTNSVHKPMNLSPLAEGVEHTYDGKKLQRGFDNVFYVEDFASEGQLHNLSIRNFKNTVDDRWLLTEEAALAYARFCTILLKAKK